MARVIVTEDGKWDPFDFFAATIRSYSGEQRRGLSEDEIYRLAFDLSHVCDIPEGPDDKAVFYLERRAWNAVSSVCSGVRSY